MTDVNANKEIIRNFIKALDGHDLDALAAITAVDLVNHAAIPEAQGLAGIKVIFGKLWKAMPDQRVSCEDLIAEGDRVVCRVRVRGTQTGPLEMARLPLPATGRETSTEHIHLFRIADGKIVEHWAGRDDIAMLRQLGHLPFTKDAS
jgi:steroid delta-isomerase-like uncharacterized protein